MIRALSLFLSLLLFSLPAALADPTAVTVTVKNYRAFEQGVQTIYLLLFPDEGEEGFRNFWRDELDLDFVKGYDRERPWQLVMWMNSLQFGGPVTSTVTSIRIPIADYEVFQKTLLEWREKNGQSNNLQIARDGDYAKLWYELAPNPELKKRHDDWEPSSIPPASKLVDISFKFGNTLRTEILGQLGMIQMIAKQSFENMPQEELPGFDPKAMAEILTYQFSIYRMFLRDLDTLTISLDLSANALVIEERVKALPDSEMASYLRSPDADPTQMVSTLDQSATLQFAAQLGENSKITTALEKLSVMSMKLNEDYATEDSLEEFGQLMEELLPKQFAGTVKAENPLSFAYTYHYPDFELDDYRKTMARLVETQQTMAGVDKPFRQIAWQQEFEVIDGTPIDRLLTVINLEHDMYRLQSPEQSQAFGRLWDEGVLDIRIAHKGDYLYMGTAGEIGRILTRTPGAERPGSRLNRNTVFYASVSPFELVGWFFGLQGEDVFAEKKPDFEGTNIKLQIDFLGDQIYSRVIVPFKMIAQMPQF